MKDLRDEIALGASNKDLWLFEFEFETVKAKTGAEWLGDAHGWKRIRTRAEARYAYAEAMMAARKPKVNSATKFIVTDVVVGLARRAYSGRATIDSSDHLANSWMREALQAAADYWFAI